MTRAQVEMSSSTAGLAQGIEAGALPDADLEHGQPSMFVRAWWLFLIVTVHAAWGLYPVVARWLQTAPAEPLPPLRLTFYINAFACASLAVFVGLPQLAVRFRRHTAIAGETEETKPMVGRGNGGGDGGSGGRSDISQRPSLREMVADIAVLAVSLGVLAAGAVFASRLTSAFLVQLVFTSSPLITAVVGWPTVSEPWPPRLLETLVLTVLGSGMVVVGNLRSSNHALSWRDPLGVVVALAATVGISVYFVWVKKTESWLREDHILYINYLSVFSFAPLCSVLFEGGHWNSLLEWTSWDWAALMYEAVGVYCIAKLTQQLIIRRLGAGVYAMFISLRLVFAIVGSYIILGETLTSALEILGCAVVCLSVTFYIWVQMQTGE